MSGFSFTQPQFTPEEEEREKADLTTDEKEEVFNDLHGLNGYGATDLGIPRSAGFVSK